jgi:hypothetical protein
MTSLQTQRSLTLAGVLRLAQGSTEVEPVSDEDRDASRGPSAGAEGASSSDAVFLAPDVQGWFASPEQGLAAGIEAVAGAEPVTAALVRLRPSSVTIVSVSDSDDACWAEVTRCANGDSETCFVALTYDGGGRVCRVVWLRAPLVSASEVIESRRTPDGLPILERYFGELQDSRFREAAACFTVDTLYSHPPYGGGTERVLYRGRQALERGFVIDRGPSPVRQVITAFSQQGDRAFVEGVVEGIPSGGTFFSTAQITSGGEIARYVAFYSGTRIPACR